MAEPPPVFEAQRHRARCRTIGDRGRRTLERWRIGEAGAALQIAVRDRGRQRNRTARAGRTVAKIERRPAGEAELPIGPDDRTAGGAARRERIINRGAAGRAQDADQILPRGVHRCRPSPPVALRSEEHTSELQSLMRISYALFCLQKKNEYTIVTKTHHTTT